MVPNLITALTGPINELEQRMLDAMPVIERWFRLEWMEHTPPRLQAQSIRFLSEAETRELSRVKGAKAGDKISVSWKDNKGETRTDEATVS